MRRPDPPGTPVDILNAEMPSITLLHITTVPTSLTFFRGQVAYMKRQGFRVHALSSPGADLDDFADREGVEVHAVEMPRRITPLRDLRAVVGILREMSRVRPAIVHAHTPKGGLLGMIAAAAHRAPVRIYHIRGLPLLGARGMKRRLLWATEWLACRLAHQVLCVSHSVRAEAVDAGICPPEKIAVLGGGSGNGVDATGRFDPDRLDDRLRAETRARLGIPRDSVVLGFVGRIVRDKGIVELTEAWRELRDRYPHLRLLMIGPFEPQDPVPPEIGRLLREDPRVHLAGMDWNTPPLYAAMDLVALPTYREGFPNVPLEAAAMRLPVVATSIPGCVDAVADGVTGLLVPPRDPAALRTALARYLDDPELRLLHGAAGRERVLREFRQEAIWEALCGEYRALLEERGLSRAGTDRDRVISEG
jgi:glycosyltransferase involved in cell wall biosynthesis